MSLLAQEIDQIMHEYSAGNISDEEKNYLIAEIRDVRAAEECANNEQLFRHIVQACNLAMSMVR